METNIILTLRSFCLINFLFHVNHSRWQCWIQAGGEDIHSVVDSRIENNLRI